MKESFKSRQLQIVVKLYVDCILSHSARVREESFFQSHRTVPLLLLLVFQSLVLVLESVDLNVEL